MNNQLIKTIGLGMIAGMRSMSAPALLSQHLSNHKHLGLVGSKIGFLQSKPFALLTKFLAAGELAGDKMAQSPDRISPAQLTGRVLSGALVGAGVYQANRDSMLKGAIIGATSAIAFTFISYYIRREISKSPKVNDKIVGFAEDALVVTGGAALMKLK